MSNKQKTITAEKLEVGKLYETVDSGVIVKAKNLIEDEEHEKYGYRKAEIVTDPSNMERNGKVVNVPPDKEFYEYEEKKKISSKVEDGVSLEDEFKPIIEDKTKKKTTTTTEGDKPEKKKTTAVKKSSSKLKDKPEKKKVTSSKPRANVKAMTIEFIKKEKDGCSYEKAKSFFEGKAKIYGLRSSFSTHLMTVVGKGRNEGFVLIRKDNKLFIQDNKKEKK